MNYSIESSKPGEVLLTLRGDLTIENSHELRNALLRSVESGTSVCLNLEKVTEIDLACIQLLCSAHQTAYVQGKHLAISEEGAETLRKMQTLSGFVRHTGCARNPSKNCLWIGGTE